HRPHSGGRGAAPDLSDGLLRSRHRRVRAGVHPRRRSSVHAARCAPTGRMVRVPSVVVMGFKGEKITHEHIYWDQATVLVQLGLLDRSTLPVSGAEEAERLLEFAGAGDSG